ncbi:MAG TPA: hypothetical protein VHR97_07120 [Candidatus Baltobacteraceae bacterium]|jgi:hypothetical protein|nr:hypothetical protein [Candidatus Baltobacteraceae bacterium]
MQPTAERKKTIGEIAIETATKKRTTAARLLRQADELEAKGTAYLGETEAEELERLNSWSSFLRQQAKHAKWLGKKCKSPSTYTHAMQLLRYIVKRQRASEEAGHGDFVEIPSETLAKRMRLSESYVRRLIVLLQGKPVRIKDRRLVKYKQGFRVFDGFGSDRFAEVGPPLEVINGGRRGNTFYVVKPEFTSTDEW